MLFSKDMWPGLADGSITLTFRPWHAAQAKQGGRYRVGGMLLEAVAVEQVPTASITEGEARRAGAAGRDALLTRLGDAHTVWRVELRHLGADDRIERRNADDIGADQLAAIRIRLDRLDRGGAWTRTTLRLIERYPGIVSTTLARHAGMERPAFKLNVRKLKELGLTESLDIGYRLSPRGQAVLAALGPV